MSITVMVTKAINGYVLEAIEDETDLAVEIAVATGTNCYTSGDLGTVLSGMFTNYEQRKAEERRLPKQGELYE